MNNFNLINGDCINEMAKLPAASVDAIVCDPPYGLEFMGKEWDKFKIKDRNTGADNPGQTKTWCDKESSGIGVGGPRFGTQNKNDLYAFQIWTEEWAREALRVLKPGGHLLAFGGSRTYHRLASAVEDAGFEIRDQIMWLYGSGFPKSLDVSKAIDKAAGAEREVVGTRRQRGSANGVAPFNTASAPVEKITKPATATATALRWQSWGTALKPAHEPIVVARKPLIGTVAANVLKHGTGAINIDGCRVGNEERTYDLTMTPGNFETTNGGKNKKSGTATVSGRWPANIILDEEAGALLNEQSGTSKSTAGTGPPGGTTFGGGEMKAAEGRWFGDKGGASRFFYCPKAKKSERNAGLNNNNHPTVKPIELMRYLCRLVTPPNGVILDPFLGSGTTGCAVTNENNINNVNWSFIGIEREDDYIEIAKSRIKYWYDNN